MLAGCALAPGSHLSDTRDRGTAESRDIFGLPFSFSTETIDVDVSRILITPDIVNENVASNISTPAQDLNDDGKVPPSDTYAYKIGNGDILSIVVWDHPELTAPFGSFNNVAEQGNVVREDGTIYYPFVGSIQATGRTALEIRNELAKKLAKFIESPQLDVRVAKYRSQRFFVAGSVLNPGTFPITDVPLSLVEAINLAGGLDGDANLFDARLSRGDDVYTVPLYDILFEGNLSQNLLVKHGDVIHVAPNERRQVFVLGEVVQPQSLPVTNRPLSLTQALASVGGIQETRADGRGVYVIRSTESPDEINVYQLDIRQAWALALGDHFILEPRDIVYVSAAPISRWNRWVSNVLPSLQGLYNLDRINQN